MVAFLGLSNHVDAVVLYDTSLNTLPGNQGWLPVIGGSTTQSHTGAYTSLNTSADRADQSGYFSEEPSFGLFEHPNMPTLDRTSGFTINFDLQVISEGHNVRDDNSDGLDDRAGFSVIAISQDLLGLELAFFENRIWAYAAAGESPNSLFTQAEGVDFDTTAGIVEYQLAMLNNSYYLYADSFFILGGALRNYNPSGLSSSIDPYNNPSFLFFGDDTTSADSNVLLGNIEYMNTAVPEPNVIWFISCIMLLTACVRKRTR